MPASFDGEAVLQMLATHEDRIQRLETVTHELAGSVGELNATMQGFSQQMRLVSENVCEKLDDVSLRLSEKMGTVAEINKELMQETRKTDERLAKLETHHVREEKKFDWKLQALMYILTTAVGVAGTLLVEFLKNH